MNATRPGGFDDIEAVLPMMRDFYAHERIAYDEERQRRLLARLLEDPRNGRLLLLESDGAIAGYIVLGFGFSLEFGGRDALLDELYVRPEFRGRGFGTGAIRDAIGLCRAEGIEAIHLESDHSNVGAHDLYLRLGFKDHARHLMTRWLK